MTDERTTSPSGECHTCGRPVTGERRLCGPCLATRVKTEPCLARTWSGMPCQSPATTPQGRCHTHRGRPAMSPPKPDPRRPHLNEPKDEIA